MDLILMKVNLHCQANNSAHHTSDITEDQLIVRRGQSFLLTLDFPRPFNPNTETLLITAVTGERPSEEHGTRSVFGIPGGIAAAPSSGAVKAGWRAELDESSILLTGTVTLAVTAAADAPIGKYFLSVSLNQKEASLGILVLLYNPWSSADSVFMAKEEERQEYVMNEQGVIFRGADNYISSLAWDYGQFEEDMVEICLKMLDVNPKHLRDPADDVSARCNPVYVSRVVSAMINANGDRGVLIGRWDGNYHGGVSPSHWNGSADILQLWRKYGCHPVKYGQCWVFAGVMCTVLRCLGIPSRVVTNFQSAHDTNKSLTIDVFYSDYGVRNRESTDSVWNYHVWVEAWMRRPDLEEDGSYDGWQVVDPTPQERSKGVFCCGPAPVSAIRQGATDLKYDVPFVFAEVNADCIDWLISANSSKTKIYSDTKTVGQNISTKSVSSNKRSNITDTYKHREGTKNERTVFKHAITRDYSRDGHNEREEEKEEEEEEGENGGTPDGGHACQEVSMRIEELSKPMSGQDIRMKLIVLSKDRVPRSLSIHVNVQAMRYTGIPAALVHSELQEETLQPGQDLSIPIVVPFSVYGDHMVGCDSLKVSAIATDRPGAIPLMCEAAVYMTEKDIVLQDPPISITVLGEARQYAEVIVEVLFRNPVNQTIKNCTLTVSGSGLLRHNIEESLPDLLPGHQLRCRIPVFPHRAGVRMLVADFDCSTFRDIKTSCPVHVKPSIPYYSYVR